MQLAHVIQESERLAGWSSRWFRLANDSERMRRMGNLQEQQDYILGRARLADAKRGRLLRAWWAYMEADDYRRNPALFNTN